MRVIIDISDGKYSVIKSDLYNTFPAEMKEWGLEAIRDGVVLPKGHGRLIDAKDAVKELFDRAPTVIEADRSEEE